jgi:tetratricopeptide (TPR) repeat protein
MKKIIYIILFCSLAQTAYCKNDVLDVIGGLIQNGNINEADQKIGYYMKRYPNDVDVLMMKGNVELNKGLLDDGALELRVNEEESVFDNSIGSITEQTKKVSKQYADSVEYYWKKAVSIDKSRVDIHKGLCTLYGWSSQKEKLIDYLPTLKKYVENNCQSAYSMGDYARLVQERGSFADAISVYKAITKLFPDCAGFYSDVASVYFKEGRMKAAKCYIDSSLMKSNKDAMVYDNAYFMYTIWGDYDKALICIKKSSEIKGSKDWLFAEFLKAYVRNEPTMRVMGERILNDKDIKNMEKERKIVSIILDNNNNVIYDKLIEVRPYTSDDLMIQNKWISVLPNDARPLLKYALIQCQNKNYTEAIKAYKQLLTLQNKLSKSQNDSVNFYYAWSLYDSGDRTGSISYWQRLFSATDFYIKSAATYFYGRILLDSGKKEEAIKVFETVSDKASSSKYATYCWNLVNKYK